MKKVKAKTSKKNEEKNMSAENVNHTQTEEQKKNASQSNEVEQNATNAELKEETPEESNKDDKAETGALEEAIRQKEELEKKIAEKDDKYLRFTAEFDNYRRRTLKEKMELTKSAGESILVNVLPVVDDFERALSHMDQAKDVESVKTGIMLIYNKFNEFLKQNVVSAIQATGQEFDTDIHEAVTKIPAADESMKGKVVDEIQKGYMLNDKVIRFSKVVIGE